MALIECFECKKQISSLAPVCPGCGAPARPVQSTSASSAPISEARKNPPKSTLIAATVSVGLMIFAAVSCTGGKGAASGETNAFDWSDALTMCQMTLKRASRDPEKAEVPYVPNSGSGDEYYFAWGASTKMARMRNGLGLEVAASASCIVSKSQKRITSLTLNGETLI